jgi:hypothetical protein
VNIDPKQPFPVPNRNNVIEWVNKAIGEISSESIWKTFLSIGYYHPEDDALNLNQELDEFELETPVETIHDEMVDLSGINLLIPDIVIQNNPHLEEQMNEEDYKDESNNDYEEETNDDEPDPKPKVNGYTMPTKDELSSGSDTMSEDEGG